MHEISFTFRELLSRAEKLSFLVGSGCSVDPPSCLPDGNTLKNELINFICVKSEVEKILDIEDLKLESVIGIFQYIYDNNLKIFDFFNLCDKPNLTHYFIAEMIKKGNAVLTTNYDYLIEYALINSGVSEGNIVPIITDNDFKKLITSEEFSIDSKSFLYKLHGSTNNIIKNQETREYLIKLIKIIGQIKNPLNLFQTEPYKREVLQNILKGTTLIVMGYSGFNDLDIMYMLRDLRNLKGIIWISHTENNEQRERIFEISAAHKDKNFDQVSKFLIQAKSLNPNLEIYRIYGNTMKMIEGIYNLTQVDQENFSINIKNWMNNNLEISNEVIKYVIPHIIYFNFNKIADVLKTGERILNMLEISKNLSIKLLVLNNVGWIYYNKGNYTDALIRFKEALQITKTFGDIRQQVIYMNNIGDILKNLKLYGEALEYYENAAKLAEKLEGQLELYHTLVNIIKIYEDMKLFSKAIEFYEPTLTILDTLDDLDSEAIILNNLAANYYNQMEFNLAFEYFQKSEEKVRETNDIKKLAIHLNNLGTYYQEIGEYDKALEKYKESLQIEKELGDTKVQSVYIEKIAFLYLSLDNYQDALIQYLEGLEKAKELNDIIKVAEFYNKIGKIYYFLKDYEESLKWFSEAVKIAEDLDNPILKADFLNNISSVYFMQLRYEDSLNIAEQSLANLRLCGLASSLKAGILRKKIREMANLIRNMT